jgi:nickel superoxide dismutase
MKKICLQILVVFSFIIFLSVNASAHCEIPCGIYDDQMRINLIKEHITTIEKSMIQIMKLEKETHHHSNQLVRWIMNKEDHADKLQEIVSQYFMTQRIKKDTQNYEKKLGLLHQLLIFSMKSKQTTDTKNTEQLKQIVKDFEAIYYDK